uniref:Sulfhydryl oxidase n=1 Tax=Steinernema glaseri TaxID=37863 RepID=A0A1I7ZHB7_9BILA
MSVAYPEKPTPQDAKIMGDFLKNLSTTYPCPYCAADLRKDLQKNPPDLRDKKSFAQWMCEMHNRVNDKLGKDLFDCSKVFERWSDGWKDGSCDY